MNYLETGLPHTDFCRRKTDFSPPRYIPLCGGLGRKYLGLEPLSKREIGGLIRRLSEPKKSVDGEEQITLLTQVRCNTVPGSGRFVGQKKMSSFEIEKMVDRLYGGRTTKDFAFVDETVQANDILNMTNRLDENDSDDDMDEENKVVKNRENALLRRQSSVQTNTEECRKRSPILRRECMSTTPYDQTKAVKGSSTLGYDKAKVGRDLSATVLDQTKAVRSRSSLKERDLVDGQVIQVDNKPRLSVNFQRRKSLRDSRKKVTENQQNIDKNQVRRNNESPSSPDPDIKRPHTCGPRRVEMVNSENVNDKKFSIFLQNLVNPPRSYTAEITRPSPSIVDVPLLHGIDGEPLTTAGDSSSTDNDTVSISDKEKGLEALKSRRAPKKYDALQQKLTKTEDNKPTRYSAPLTCDELLIDRVATCNRSPRLRCK